MLCIQVRSNNSPFMKLNWEAVIYLSSSAGFQTSLLQIYCHAADGQNRWKYGIGPQHPPVLNIYVCALLHLLLRRYSRMSYVHPLPMFWFIKADWSDLLCELTLICFYFMFHWSNGSMWPRGRRVWHKGKPGDPRIYCSKWPAMQENGPPLK